MFSGMEYFPHLRLVSENDKWINNIAILRATTAWRKQDWKPDFDEQLAIRHHRMTIALAMPQRGKHGL